MMPGSSGKGVCRICNMILVHVLNAPDLIIVINITIFIRSHFGFDSVYLTVMAASPLFGSLYETRRRPSGGGLHQRRAALALEDAPEPAQPARTPSRLATGLLLDWADGDIQSSKCCKHMQNAKMDGSIDPIVLKTAWGHSAIIQRA